MTNTPQPNDRESSAGYPLGFDEFVAILVALLTLGTTLFWAFSRYPSGGWNLNWLSNSNLAPKSAKASKNKVDSSVSLPKVHQENNRANFPGLMFPFSVSKDQQENADPKISSRDSVLSTESQKSNSSISGESTDMGKARLPWISSITPAEKTSESKIQKSPIYPSVGSKETVGDLKEQESKEKQGKEKDPSLLVTPADKKPAIPTPKVFTDLNPQSWEVPFVNALSSRGMIEGYKTDASEADNSFKPNQPVTRAEYAALLNKAFQDQTSKKLDFSDVKSDYWANKAIQQAVATGFLNGYPNKDATGRIFVPEREIPRVEVLVALVTGLDLKLPADVEKVLSIYPDNQKIPKYARPKIAAATVNNLVVNPNNPQEKLLEPTKNATRAEVAAMIHQALVKADKIPPVNSDSILRYQ